MTLTLDIPAGVGREKLLRAAVALYDAQIITQGQAADMAGLSRVEFFDALGRHGVTPFQDEGADAAPDAAGVADAIRRAASPDDKAARLLRWLDGHDRRAPALPDAAVSREAVYSDGAGD